MLKHSFNAACYNKRHYTPWAISHANAITGITRSQQSQSIAQSCSGIRQSCLRTISASVLFFVTRRNCHWIRSQFKSYVLGDSIAISVKRKIGQVLNRFPAGSRSRREYARVSRKLTFSSVLSLVYIWSNFIWLHCFRRVISRNPWILMFETGFNAFWRSTHKIYSNSFDWK